MNKKNTSILTGNLSKEERDLAIENFSRGKAKVLITTNLLSRGYDEKKVNLVINFDLPKQEFEQNIFQYLHRVGRTGRFGRLGVALSIITNDQEKNIIKEISQSLKIEFKHFKTSEMNKLMDYLEQCRKKNEEDEEI